MVSTPDETLHDLSAEVYSQEDTTLEILVSTSSQISRPVYSARNDGFTQHQRRIPIYQESAQESIMS